jgi:hypothetical protein
VSEETFSALIWVAVASPEWERSPWNIHQS